MRKVIREGTKVKIKSGLEDLRDNNGRINGLYCDSNMYEYEGQELEIINSWLNNGVNYFTTRGNSWTWNIDMIEEVSEENMKDLDRICADCGRELEDDEELIYVEEYDRYVCSDCLEYYHECEDCGRLIHEDDLHGVEGGDRSVCDSCFDDYRYCENCHDYFYYENMIYDDDTGEYYCEDCYNELSRGRVYGYHQFNDWEFFKANGEIKPPFYIGHELEVENPNYDNDCKSYLYDNLNVVLMHDGSLNSGYEIISHPQSFKYIMEHKEDYKNALEELINHGYKSHETDTCGLHFHVSRPYIEEIKALRWSDNEEDKQKREELLDKQELIIDRIILFMETYKEELINFSRRKPNQLSQWAKFLSDTTNKPNGEIKSLYYIKKHKTTSNRYQALNLTNENTIEFRIFRGTLKYETFMASIELVNNIVEQCSDLSKPITDINWNTITQGEFVRAYCEERGIETDKVIEDNSEEEIAREQMIKEIIGKAYKDLIKIYNKEIKRMAKDMIVKPNKTFEEINDRLMLSNSITYRLRNIIDYLNNVINATRSLENGNGDIDYVQNRIRDFVNSYDLSFIDWTQEGYKEVREQLEQLL